MPPTLKRKSSSSELDLDALFADLDATIQTTGTTLTAPKKLATAVLKPAKTKNKPHSQLIDEKKRQNNLATLYDGLNSTSSSVQSSRLLVKKPVTPVKARSPLTPRRPVAKALTENDLNALFDGVDWDEFDEAPTPGPSTRKLPRTPRSPFKSYASDDDLSASIRRSGGSASKRRRVTLTPMKTQSLILDGTREEGQKTGLKVPLTDRDLKNTIRHRKPPVPRSEPPRMPAPDQVRDRTTRCSVSSIEDTTLKGRREKRLHLITDDATKLPHLAILKDDWASSTVNSGDIVNLIGEWEKGGAHPVPTMILSTSRNILIVHPDLLVPATSISSGSRCNRKALLSSLVRSSSNDVTPSTVWGLMLHEVVQSCLAAGEWGDSFVERKIDEVIHSSLDRLVQIRIGFDEAKSELKNKSKGLKRFSELYISPTPKPEAFITDAASASKIPARLAISDMKDAEEMIWSPSYGLKGVVDASVESRIIQNHGLFSDNSQWVLPMEIKTGRATNVSEHRAQTILYTLLMSERYGLQVPAGLLYYTQSDEVIKVPASRNELRGLITSRNEIAAHTMRRRHLKLSTTSQPEESATPKSIIDVPPLPPTIDDEWSCSKCYNVDICMVYRKTYDQVEDDISPIAELYSAKTSHLTDHHSSFFRHWESLISLEEQDLNRYHQELWTMTAPAREKTGRCYADMVIAGYETAPEDSRNGRAESRRHLYSLRRKADQNPTERSASLLGILSKGDAVILSVEPNLLGLGRGFIADLQRDEIVIAIDRVLTPDVLSRGLSSDCLPITQLSDVVFRIDKDELATGMTRVRDNLAQLFYAKSDRRLLSLVVDLKPPSFDESEAGLERAKTLTALSPSQESAVQKVLSAQDYALVLGMPGTGKTTTIAEIIKILVARGQRVLLTSYTHSAVDTILRKLVDTDINVLRLGQDDKIHPEVRKYGLNSLPLANSLEELEHQLLTPPVVATTCLSIDHPLFSRRTFDVCIVDEASQITLPTCLGPLRFAKRFVLVGDHHQLPPLVRSRDARKAGLDESLFRRLCTAHPQAVVDLTSQYRMNEDIMLLANELVYDNKLTCGTREVAERSLTLPDPRYVERMHTTGTSCSEERCWLEDVLDPSRKVVFVDTDEVPGKESRSGDLVQNETEVALVHQITEALLGGGIDESQIGLISLYRQQNKLLAQALAAHPNIEVLTADRSQGRDKDCIIVSMTRSNKRGDIGELLKDSRRLNVTLTRARAKLIIIGSRSTMACEASSEDRGSSSEPLSAKLMRVLAQKKWILTLPPDAHLSHASVTAPRSDSASSQALGGGGGKDGGFEPSSSGRSKKGTIAPSLLHRQSMLRDVANDI